MVFWPCPVVPNTTCSHLPPLLPQPAPAMLASLICLKQPEQTATNTILHLLALCPERSLPALEPHGLLSRPVLTAAGMSPFLRILPQHSVPVSLCPRSFPYPLWHPPDSVGTWLLISSSWNVSCTTKKTPIWFFTAASQGLSDGRCNFWTNQYKYLLGFGGYCYLGHSHASCDRSHTRVRKELGHWSLGVNTAGERSGLRPWQGRLAATCPHPHSPWAMGLVVGGQARTVGLKHRCCEACSLGFRGKKVLGEQDRPRIWCPPHVHVSHSRCHGQ